MNKKILIGRKLTRSDLRCGRGKKGGCKNNAVWGCVDCIRSSDLKDKFSSVYIDEYGYKKGGGVT